MDSINKSSSAISLSCYTTLLANHRAATGHSKAPLPWKPYCHCRVLSQHCSLIVHSPNKSFSNHSMSPLFFSITLYSLNSATLQTFFLNFLPFFMKLKAMQEHTTFTELKYYLISVHHVRHRQAQKVQNYNRF